MTRYLILDGYNIIGALARYATHSTGGLDESRELLVNDVLKAAGWMGKKIIVVFDAARSLVRPGSGLREASKTTMISCPVHPAALRASPTRSSLEASRPPVKRVA